MPANGAPTASVKEKGSTLSPSSSRITPLPEWEEMTPMSWEDLRKRAIKEEVQEEVKPKEEEDESKKKDDFPPNPYRYAIQESLPISLPRFPLGMALRELKREVPTPDEIKENINELKKVSKACVDTIGQGVDAYWMMSNDLEAKVDGLYNKIDTLFDFTTKLFARTSLLTKLATEQ